MATKLKLLVQRHPVVAVTGVSTLSLYSYLHYKTNGKPLSIKRVPYADDCSSSKIHLLEIAPEWRQKYGTSIRSLGEYLATLKPPVDTPDWLERELKAALANALISSVGPTIGAVLVPLVKHNSIVDNITSSVANVFATVISKQDDNSGTKETFDGGVPLSLFALMYVAELNYQRVKQAVHQQELEENNSKQQPQDTADNAVQASTQKTQLPDAAPTPLQSLAMGEVGYELSFVDLVPNTFILNTDWHRVMQEMEQRMPSYNPDSRAMPPPQPVNERLLPGLHIGFGNYECTHSQRQLLQNRLLSTLLNRLAANYLKNDTEKKFVIKLDNNSKKEITKPYELIQALIDSGHKVETCIRGQVTTFGVGLCVKEPDNSWTSIPIALFLQTGFTDNNNKGLDQKDAYVMLPHTGLDLDVSDGPLIKEKLNIQHYMSMGGVCMWQSNHNSTAPWIVPVNCGKVYTKANDVTRSVRLAALKALIINGVATNLNLPLGGYGLTGVCNDGAALVEMAMSDQLHVYPITFGRFSMANLQYATHLRENTIRTGDEVKDLDALIKALKTVPTDLSPSPKTAKDQIDRYLHMTTKSGMPFKIMHDSKRIVEAIRKDLE